MDAAKSVKGTDTHFGTSSADKTIRFWTLSGHTHDASIKKHKKVLFIGSDYSHFKASPVDFDKILDPEISVEGVARCLGFSPDGNHIAAGDLNGELHIFDSNTYRKI